MKAWADSWYELYDWVRSGLTIIPQDPSLMKGSLRYNIDPLESYTDERIIEIVNSVGMGYLIENNEKGLQQPVSESGTNLSVGEKQLICICRALLRVNILNLEFQSNCNGWSNCKYRCKNWRNNSNGYKSTQRFYCYYTSTQN